VQDKQFDKYKTILRSKLNENRYNHSLCVANEAKRLAIKYGGDPEKCYLAGLLHDITKNAPDNEHLKLFETFDIILNDIEKNAKKLWHAMSGAVYLENILGIKDAELLDAVRYHTTAKAGMSLTAKILYLADFTSADRDYEDVDEMRRLVDISLEKALVYALEYSIIDLIRHSRAVHPDTFEAYNETVLKLEEPNGIF
jgi:predicted HD superfamily hydrolase involved in NAD metabolism